MISFSYTSASVAAENNNIFFILNLNGKSYKTRILFEDFLLIFFFFPLHFFSSRFSYWTILRGEVLLIKERDFNFFISQSTIYSKPRIYYISWEESFSLLPVFIIYVANNTSEEKKFRVQWDKRIFYVRASNRVKT